LGWSIHIDGGIGYESINGVGGPDAKGRKIVDPNSTALQSTGSLKGSVTMSAVEPTSEKKNNPADIPRIINVSLPMALPASTPINQMRPSCGRIGHFTLLAGAQASV